VLGFVEPAPQVRIGVIYQSKTRLELSGDLELPSGLSGAKPRPR
jgi:hypothetical protein